MGRPPYPKGFLNAPTAALPPGWGKAIQGAKKIVARATRSTGPTEMPAVLSASMNKMENTPHPGRVAPGIKLSAIRKRK